MYLVSAVTKHCQEHSSLLFILWLPKGHSVQIDHSVSAQYNAPLGVPIGDRVGLRLSIYNGNVGGLQSFRYLRNIGRVNIKLKPSLRQQLAPLRGG